MFIGDLVAAAIEGGAAIAQLFCEALSFAGGSLSDPKKKITPRRVVVALLPGALFAGAIGSWMGWEWWQSHRTTKTVAVVNEWTETLSQRRLANGQLDRVKDAKLDATDAWNQPLQVRYDDFQLGESVTVTSAGPDRVVGTRDDISSTKPVLSVKKSARALAGVVGDAIQDRFLKKANEEGR